MSQVALNATIGQLQGAVRNRLANEQAFKVRVYNEINLILARLRECAAAVASAPPGPASAAAVVNLNAEIAALQAEISNLQNNLLDENDVGDVTGTLARNAPNLRFDTQANMQRFTRAPPAYVNPGPREARPLASSSVQAAPGILGALSGLNPFASAPRPATGAVGPDGAQGAANGAGQPDGSGLAAPVSWGPEDDLDDDGYPSGPPAASIGGWTPKRKTPKRKPKKKSVRR